MTDSSHLRLCNLTVRVILKKSALDISSTYLVVHFEAGEHGVFKAHIDTYYVVDQCVGFVGFQRRGDGQSGGRVSVQNIHQLLFLYRS